MDGIKSRIRKIKYKLNYDLLSLDDIVLVVATVLCLVWTFQSIEAMSRNWELSERLTAEKKTLELLKVEVETAELENEYLRSEEYQELLARKQLDKKLPDENMVVMPENSEIAINKYKTIASDVTQKEYSNFEKWTRFLFPNY